MAAWPPLQETRVYHRQPHTAYWNSSLGWLRFYPPNPTQLSLKQPPAILWARIAKQNATETSDYILKMQVKRVVVFSFFFLNWQHTQEIPPKFSNHGVNSARRRSNRLSGWESHTVPAFFHVCFVKLHHLLKNAVMALCHKGRCFTATPKHFPVAASHRHAHTQKHDSNAQKIDPFWVLKETKSSSLSLEYWWVRALRLPTDPFPLAATHTHRHTLSKQS